MRQAPAAILAGLVQRRVRNLTPPQALILSFVGLAVAGMLLLKLPIASHQPTSWAQALFTAVSAATVTGLGVVDTGTHFTLFGKSVLIVLMALSSRPQPLGVASPALYYYALIGWFVTAA